jgi:UDP-glucose 4-epimerase
MKIHDKKILITGGAGFIGSNLLNRLIDDENEIIVLDNLFSGFESNIKNVDHVSFYKYDICDVLKIKNEIKDIDMVFHLAANASVPYSIKDPVTDFHTNAYGTVVLLDALRHTDVKKILFASSAAVYGNPVYSPINEQHPTTPISPYGVSKLAAETMGFIFKDTYGLNFVSSRIFNVYGPGQKKYVMYDFINKLLHENIFKILGSGEQKRNFCYIEDAITAFYYIISKGDGIYNISGDEIISIKELAIMMMDIVGIEKVMEITGKSWPGDIYQLVGSNNKLKTLGYKQKVDLTQGIRNLCDCMLKQNI